MICLTQDIEWCIIIHNVVLLPGQLMPLLTRFWKAFQPISFPFLAWVGWFTFAYSNNGNINYIITIGVMILFAFIFTTFRLRAKSKSCLLQ